jgi:2'-5' RNA ligase
MSVPATDRPKRLRLFIALDVPPEVRGLVEEAIAPWRARFPSGRWVPIDNWHVTLVFLGATSPDLVGWIASSLTDVAAATRSFGSRVEGLGAFRSTRRARVLWAGLRDDDGAMARLADRLAVALAREFTPDPRELTPHLTVARFDPPVELGEDFGRVMVRSELFEVDRITLYRSHLRRPWPVYEPIAVFPFSGRSPGN